MYVCMYECVYVSMYVSRKDVHMYIGWTPSTHSLTHSHVVGRSGGRTDGPAHGLTCGGNPALALALDLDQAWLGVAKRAP